MTYQPSIKIRCVAHRGDSKHCPENSRASFISAIEKGAHAIELDVQMSADNKVFVFHDEDFSRMKTPSIPNHQTPFREIVERDIGSWFEAKFRAEKPMSIKELFSSIAVRINLLIEIKTWLPLVENKTDYEKMLNTIAAHADETDTWEKIELLCYEKEILSLARSIDKRFHCVLNTDDPLSSDELKQIKTQGIDIISAYIENLTPSFVAAVHEEGLALYVFTCNRIGQVEKALSSGAIAIMSDDPAWLIKQVYGN